MFIFIGGNIPASGTLMSEIFDKYADEDGFLYVIYSGENTFGSQ
jgi:GABA(A) receptor-associated protein